MDNITHSLVGALIGQAGLKRRTGLAMPALIVGANLPDVDAVTVLLGGMEHLALRRGVTHGPIAWVLLPLLLAGALWWFDRWQARRGTRPEGRAAVHFGWLYALAFIACLTHPALDWLNVYGVRLLEPFSDCWFYGDTLFIIDVWLWVGMGFATWFSLRREKRGGEWRQPAWFAIAVALAYIGANWTWSRISVAQVRSTLPALECAETVPDCDWPVISSPLPLVPWKREMLWINKFAKWVRADYNPFGPPTVPKLLTSEQCLTYAGNPNDQFDAFWSWSRAPFFEPSPTGGLLLRDARFYDPRARDRFTVELPGFRCV